MSEHKWVSVSIDGKMELVCKACNVKESYVATYRESPYCEKTPEAIEARERSLEQSEYRRLISARDHGGKAGVDFFKSQQSRWEYLSNKYGQK